MRDPRDDRQFRSWSAVVRAIVTGPSAWSTPSAIAGALGLDPRRVGARLDELESAGWAVAWDCPTLGRSWTLTPAVAARLGVKLGFRAHDDARPPRWVAAGEPEPNPRAGLDVPARAVDWDRLPDLRPLDLADAWAERERRAESRAEPAPVLLVGLGLPWPIQCRHGAPPPGAYCLACDAWGGRPRPEPRPAPAPRRAG